MYYVLYMVCAFSEKDIITRGCDIPGCSDITGECYDRRAAECDDGGKTDDGLPMTTCYCHTDLCNGKGSWNGAVSSDSPGPEGSSNVNSTGGGGGGSSDSNGGSSDSDPADKHEPTAVGALMIMNMMVLLISVIITQLL